VDDGIDPWIRTIWQINAFQCDPDTGEVLIERCPESTAMRPSIMLPPVPTRIVQGPSGDMRDGTDGSSEG
jgi:hypothetical protein